MTSKRLIYDWSKVPVVVDPPYIGILLGIHPDTVTRLIRKGEIKGFRVGNSGELKGKSL